MAKASAPSTQGPPTRVDRFLQWTRNNRVVAVLVIVGTVAGALGSFADSAKKLFTSVAEVTGSAPAPTAAELQSRAKTREAARVVGTYYARAMGEQVLDNRAPYPDELRGLQSAVRGMIVAFHAQKDAQKVQLGEMAMAVLAKLDRATDLPDYWQSEELKSQQDEVAGIFAALGESMPGVVSAAPAAGAK